MAVMAVSDGKSQHRHCERSEAIQCRWKDSGLLRRFAPRNDETTSVRRDLDEAWELDLGLGDFRRPHAGLRPVLPLQHQSGDQPLAVFQAMGELVLLAVELD